MADTSSGTAAHPPRYWWLKRLTVAGVVVLLALVGLRLWWGHVMAQRLESAVAAIEARGEPIRFDDMKRAPVPDADNAAVYLRQALAQWPPVDGVQTIDQTDWHNRTHYEDIPDPITDNAAYLAECAEVFALLEQAAEAPECDWGVQWVSPTINIMMPQWGQSRQLARLIDDAARRAHDIGDDRLAIELLSRLLVIADTHDQPDGLLIGHLIAISLRVMYSTTIEELLSTIRIDTNDPSAAKPEQLRDMIDALLDEAAHRRHLADTYVAERWSAHDNANAFIDGRLPPAALGIAIPIVHTRPFLLLMGPMLTDDAIYMLDFHTDLIEQARQAERLSEFDNLLQAQEQDFYDRSLWRYPMSRLLLPSMDATVRTHFQFLSTLRVTAIALAIKLYEHDHGRRPETLAELVPDYLDAVPMDPLAASPREIGYLPDGVQPIMVDVITSDPAAREALAQRRFAVLYSVGTDGEDDGGQCWFDEDGTLILGFSVKARDEGGDEAFHLDASPEALPQMSEEESAFGPDGYPGGPGGPGGHLHDSGKTYSY